MKSEKLKDCRAVVIDYRLFLSLLFAVYCLLSAVFPAYALDVKREALPNGLTLLVVEKRNLPVVMVTVGIKAGTLMEPEEKAGLSNLTAELLTEGTRNRTSAQISEEIEFVGASLDSSGGDDYITVALSVLKKDIELGFSILSDIIVNPNFPETELNRKKALIKGSIKAQEEEPGAVASKAFKKAIFGNHPYGRPVEGAVETLDALTREDIVSFHSRYYVPNDSVMAVVGDISSDEVKSLMAKYFDRWKPQKLDSPQSRVATTLPHSPEPLKGRKVIKINRDLTQANIIMGHLGIKRDNPDYYAVSIANYILGSGGFASRLMQNIRDEKGLAYDVHSFFTTNKEKGAFQVGVQTKNESANAVVAEILKEIKRIREEPISDTELQDARAYLTGSFPLRIDTSRKIADFLVAVEYYGLGLDYIDKYKDYINAVTKDDVLRVAKKYLDPERFALIIVADQEKASLKY
ncbi:MAG: insulinase family protein [Nitrospirae bacterium]|nr:insulinase family protein [Nitrospirota bacterium]